MIHHKLIIDLVHQKDFQIPKSVRILALFRKPDCTEGASDPPPDIRNAYYYITPELNISTNHIPGIDYQLRYCERNKMI